MTCALTGLEGKLGVVTGAGRRRGIGRSIAVALARAGCDVVITGNSPDCLPDDEKQAGWRDIDSVAEEIRALGRRALPVVSNVADPDAVAVLGDTVMREFGRGISSSTTPAPRASTTGPRWSKSILRPGARSSTST